MTVSCECCVLSGGGFLDGPIIHPEYSYRLYVLLSVIRSGNDPLHLQWIGQGQTKKKKSHKGRQS